MLIDFGFSKSTLLLYKSNTTVGTSEYMAPEVITQPENMSTADF